MLAQGDVKSIYTRFPVIARLVHVFYRQAQAHCDVILDSTIYDPRKVDAPVYQWNTRYYTHAFPMLQLSSQKLGP